MNPLSDEHVSDIMNTEGDEVESAANKTETPVIDPFVAEVLEMLENKGD